MFKVPKILIFFILFILSLSSALASEESCIINSSAMVDAGLTGPLNDVSKLAIFNMIKDCSLTAANAAWESVESAGNCIMNPIDCAESAANGIRNAYSFITNLSEELHKIWDSFRGLSAQQIGELLCSTVGALAPDLLLAILTAGAASGKLGPTIARLILKIQKIVGLIRGGIGLSIRLLGELSDQGVETIKKLLQNGGLGDFQLEMRRLGCAVP